MAVNYRPLRRRDFGDCFNSLATHPILASRYGHNIRFFRPALVEVFGSDSFIAVVFEEIADSSKRFIGAGMGGFVTDEFLLELKSDNFPWLGPEIFRRIVQGRSPLLSSRQMRESNTRGGLNLVVWHTSIHPADFGRADVGAAAMAAFNDSYQGYLLKEIFAQADCFEQLIGIKNCGGYHFDRGSRTYGAFPMLSIDQFPNEPRDSGISRELALSGSWLGALFAHRPPQFGFTRGEQGLLVCALSGNTDFECAKSLHISVSAVKRAWRNIYERVERRSPELLPACEHTLVTSTRGKAKKYRLLAYLQGHPEELRPISRRVF
jgi:hypothetical protein